MNYRESSPIYLEYKENEECVIDEFKNFVRRGVPGESARIYRSVNSRNEEKVREEFIIRLLRDKPSVTKLNNVLTSVALKACNRDESQWLFDFDVDDEKLVAKFIYDINYYSNIPLEYIKCHNTPHGYAIVVPHGFDTRKLMEKWENYDVTLKRDDMLFLDIITK